LANESEQYDIPRFHVIKRSLGFVSWAAVLLKRKAWVIEEIIKDYWAGMLAVRLRRNCLPLLLPEQASTFPVFPTYTAPEHPSNSPLPLMLDTIRVKEL